VKRQIITVGVVALILGALVAFNRIEPDRKTPEQVQASEKATEEIAKVDLVEAMLNAQEKPAEGAAVAGNASKTFKVKFECSNGNFVVECDPSWAPLGAARFKEIVEQGVFENAKFFRVVPGFVVQFGIPADPAVSAKWTNATIKDDPVKQSNKRGAITFATGGKDTRTTQVFINYGDNSNLDALGFSPFGKVIEGMDVVEKIERKYGDAPTPLQGQIEAKGNAFLDERFPGLDYIKKATIVP